MKVHFEGEGRGAARNCNRKFGFPILDVRCLVFNAPSTMNWSYQAETRVIKPHVKTRLTVHTPRYFVFEDDLEK